VSNQNVKKDTIIHCAGKEVFGVSKKRVKKGTLRPNECRTKKDRKMEHANLWGSMPVDLKKGKLTIQSCALQKHVKTICKSQRRLHAAAHAEQGISKKHMTTVIGLNHQTSKRAKAQSRSGEKN